MKKNFLDEKYLNLLDDIIKNGTKKNDRTKVGTISVFGREIKAHMKDGFLLLTSKKMFIKGIIIELLWFLKGDTNIKYLIDNDVNIWNNDAYNYYKKIKKDWLKNKPINSPEVLLLNKDLTIEEFLIGVKEQNINDSLFDINYKYGDLGSIYGKQWKRWGEGEIIWEETPNTNGTLYSKKNPGINQIQNLIDDLINEPDSRRLMVNAWNVSDIPKCALPPCHYCFQCYTRELSEFERGELYNQKMKGFIDTDDVKTTYHFDNAGIPKRELSLKWEQRSVDSCLGLPYNIASYAFLLHMLAQQTNMVPGELIGSLGDTHIYNNQLDIVEEQLKNETFELCTLELNKATSIFDYKYEDFKIKNYKSAGKVNYPLSN